MKKIDFIHNCPLSSGRGGCSQNFVIFKEREGQVTHYSVMQNSKVTPPPFPPLQSTTASLYYHLSHLVDIYTVIIKVKTGS